MRDIVLANLEGRFGFYADLARQVDDATLSASVDVPGHRSIGLHLWCVVGARESYAKAIAAGEMRGWASSLENFTRSEVSAKLAAAAQAVLDAVSGIAEWTPERERLLAELAEHEAMHEGQLIRALLALEQPLPASCHWAVCG